MQIKSLKVRAFTQINLGESMSIILYHSLFILETGRASCVTCLPGFFSDSISIESCKKWTEWVCLYI